MTHYTRTLIGLAAVLLLSAPVRAHVNILLDNTPQVNLSARRGQTIPFAIEVPENVDRLTVESFGGQGDGDLYLRRGAVPTTEVYDFRSRNSRNDEAFRIDKPEAGWWYAVLVAHRDFSGVSVRTRFEIRERGQLACPAHPGGTEIVRELPAFTAPGEPVKDVIHGVVMWQDIAPSTDYFTVFMSGFSSGYRLQKGPDGEPLTLRRTIVQQYWRPGDRFDQSEREIRKVNDPLWIYRPDDLDEDEADAEPEPPTE